MATVAAPAAPSPAGDPDLATATTDALYAALGASPAGLDAGEAARRLASYGPNELTSTGQTRCGVSSSATSAT